MSDHYRPLPKCLTIRESGIDGLGVFAKEDLAEGLDLGVTHLYDFSFKDNAIRTPLGGFINHCTEPNCRIGIDEEYDDMASPYSDDYLQENGNKKLITLREIKEGEEITVSYSMYDPTK